MHIQTIAATRRPTSPSGHSLVETLTTVALLAILVSIGHFIWSGLKRDGSDLKLISQVKMLNESVSICRANGGQILGSHSADEVIETLKMVASPETADTINGYRGAAVDVQLRGVMQTPAEAATDQRRVIWNGATMRFEIRTGGPAGYKRFELDDLTAQAAPEHRQGTMDLAENSRWVWDYNDVSSNAPGFDGIASGGSNPGDPPDGVTQQGTLQLDPPIFSVPGGTYEWGNFALPVEFFNPNPPGVSDVFYSVGGADYQLYIGSPVLVEPGDTLTAYSVSIAPDDWFDSELAAENYDSTFVITGYSSGLFSNPTGGPNMVTGGWGNYFTWGTPATHHGYTDPSWLLFEGASYVDVLPGERFLLGTIDYYNGTIFSQTGADTLDLSIDLTFNEGMESVSFDYELELINTHNHPNNTPEESADYVKFGDISSETPVILGGLEYTLLLEFGETTEFGFSSIDQFHVWEDETATGQLYGSLVPAWGG